MSTSSVACFRYPLPMSLTYLLNANLSKLGVLGGIDGSSRSESMTQGKMNVQTEASLTRRDRHREAYIRRVYIPQACTCCSVRVIVALRDHQSLCRVFLSIREVIQMTRVDGPAELHKLTCLRGSRTCVFNCRLEGPHFNWAEISVLLIANQTASYFQVLSLTLKGWP